MSRSTCDPLLLCLAGQPLLTCQATPPHSSELGGCQPRPRLPEPSVSSRVGRRGPWHWVTERSTYRQDGAVASTAEAVEDVKEWGGR